VGSFFSLFVPQLCYGNGGQNNPPHPCTMMEIISTADSYTQGAIALNSVTALAFVGTFAYEFYRENWIKNHFVIDEHLPNDHISNNLDKFPLLNEKLKRINSHHGRMISVVLHLSNVNILSSFFLLRNDDNGFQTYTTFATNIFIIYTRMFRSINISSTSDTKVFVKSVFSIPTEYNLVKPSDAEPTQESGV